MTCFGQIRGPDGVCDLRRLPTTAGFLPEVFRRSKGVQPSVNCHSVTAIGHGAKELVQDHWKSETSGGDLTLLWHNSYFEHSADREFFTALIN